MGEEYCEHWEMTGPDSLEKNEKLFKHLKVHSQYLQPS